MPRALSLEFVHALKETAFWEAIVNDVDLCPEVRDGSVTVYYRGAAMVRDIRLSAGGLVADVSEKYVPLMGSENARIALKVTDGKFDFHEPPRPLPVGSAAAEVIAAYKARMREVGTREQKIIQSVCRDQRNTIIDQEYCLALPGQPRGKVDLVYFDHGRRAIGFCEVKGLHDSRLQIGTDGTRGIVAQLRGYAEGISALAALIKRDIIDIVTWKKELGLEGRLRGLTVGMEWRLYRKPLLVIGGVSRADVSQIVDAGGPWIGFQEAIRPFASGLVLCGEDGCVLRCANDRQATCYDGASW